MSNDLNQCSFIGRLGRDPETRYMPSGKAVANFSIAVGSKWKDKASGDSKESTEWVNIVAFDKLGEICSQYLRKGSQVFIQGSFKTRSWEKDGVKRYSTEIIANQMQMLGGKRADSEETRREAKPAVTEERDEAPADDFSDDIPFVWIATGLFSGLLCAGSLLDGIAKYAA